MQAIRTYFIGPTNYRGSRVKAVAAAGSITLPWDHALNPLGNHRAAAKALAEQYDWPGRWTPGDIADGSTIWVNLAWTGSDDFTCKGRDR